MKVVDEVEIHSCGSGAAHSPHPSRMLAGWWCPGVLPLWPCGLRRLHPFHLVNNANFACPGTLEPPRSMTGPRYSVVDVCEAIEAAGQAEDLIEEFTQ